MSGALLIGGTTSDAGKSVVVAGLCRSLARRGVSVAPFKAQNMSNNSVVTIDGGEIGRAQAMQALACGLEPDTRFNPVLLKPGGDGRSQVIVRGRADGYVGAGDYHARRAALAGVVADELRGLRAAFDVVICEGAGSVAETNLRASDIANMGLAAAADLPVLVVGDIDRGGVIAHMVGTLAVLGPDDQRRVAGFVINKFRGDRGILAPGVDDVERWTGRPVVGVLPYTDGLWLDAEDSLASPIGRVVGVPAPAIGTQRLSVAAIRLPRISNSTDVEALACEPGVDVRWVDDIASVRTADLVVLPGTKATVSDLAWLRTRGLADALADRAAAAGPILGICGGYQMLGRSIDDDVESGAGTVPGLGLLSLHVRFAADKTLRRCAGTALGARVTGYEIHHGRAVASDDPTWVTDDETGPEGSVRGSVRGTHWHGMLGNDALRAELLAEVAAATGRTGFTAGRTDFEAARSAQIDLLADVLDEWLDMAAVDALIAGGIPADLPTMAPLGFV